jgi:hypothetical protein
MSMVSRAIFSCFSGGWYPRVCMLWRRSASLTMITRMSVAMARIILRMFSACCSSLVLNCILLILVTPSTMLAVSLPKRRSSSDGLRRRVLEGVVKETCRDTDHIHFHLGEDMCDFKGVGEVRLA